MWSDHIPVSTRLRRVLGERFPDADSVRAATDNALLRIPGIGRGALAELARAGLRPGRRCPHCGKDVDGALTDEHGRRTAHLEAIDPRA